MYELNEALSDIRTMRAHLARGAAFGFYGPVAIGFTAVLALGAACLQSLSIPVPTAHPAAYLVLWGATAGLAAAAIAADVGLRARRARCGLADDMVREAAGQLLPAGAAGALLTIVLARYAPQCVWLLPGLWQIILALGVFSACRTLPAPMRLVGFWYVASGLVCVALGQGAGALSPWAMGAPFGIGEALAACLLYRFGGAREQEF